jgi:Sedlin, N-terminal conserved region
MSMLTGIAIIGKSNEPLYLCDCERSNEGTLQQQPVENDPFGFTSSHTEQRNSLPLQRQIIVHAALDCLEEMVQSSVTGQMPVIRNATRTAPHWVGLLLELDGQAVYGYITATNIKFMALTRGKCETKVMQGFLKELHQHYCAYISNPFCNTRGSIISKQFDARITQSVAKVQQPAAIVD